MRNTMEELKRIFLKHTRLVQPEIKHDSIIVEDFNLDSIQYVTALVELEIFFDIEVGEEFLTGKGLTLKSFADYIDHIIVRR